jgi:hypothetical protein
MFKFFKKSISKEEKFNSLISKQTHFSLNATAMHPILIAWAPDKSRAIYELFVFHNWFSYYMLSRHICASLPATTSANEIEDAKKNIASKIICSANVVGIPILQKKHTLNVDDYCNGNFEKCVQLSFFGYDSSVANHECPDWASAAIKLSASARIPGLADFSNLQETAKRIATLQKEVLAIFMSVEELIKADVKDYLSS